MKKKQWIAIAVALVLFVASVLIPSRTSKQQEKIEEAVSNSLDSYTENIFGKFGKMDEITEEVLEVGDKTNRILVLDLDGAIMDTSANQNPFAPIGYNHKAFLEELDKVLEDDSIKAILFKVNSPGGGVYESAEIRNKILKIKNERQIPIYVSMQKMAASGGYWISADADKIFAHEETITGSIGVISQAMDYSGLMEKYGVKMNTYKSGPNKDMGSPYKPATEEEVAIWNAFTQEVYSRFVNVVANGRNMPEERVREIADGRIYTAYQAKANGLIDEIAFTEDVLEALKKDNSLEGAEVFMYKANPNPFASLGFVKSNLYPSSELEELRKLMDMQNEPVRPMLIYGGN